MKPVYYILSADGLAKYAANIRPASHRDFIRTEQENWQTSWLIDGDAAQELFVQYLEEE